MTEEEEMAADAVMIADLQIIAACGSSYYSSAVADVAMDGATVTDAAMTAVHGLSFFCYSVVEDAATTVYLTTTAADVDAAATNPYVEDTFLNIPDIY